MHRLLVAAVMTAAVIASLAATPGALAWTWPAEGPVLRPFSVSSDPYAAGQHRGVDIGAELGRQVVAPAGGTVSFVGFVPGGGRAVTIATDDGYAVTLLQLGATSVERGSTLAEGTEVGVVGESSDAVTLQPHVHLGVRVAADPNGYVDPLGLLPARPARAGAAFVAPRAARGRSASCRHRRDPGAAAHTGRASGLRAGRRDAASRRCRDGASRRTPCARSGEGCRDRDPREGDAAGWPCERTREAPRRRRRRSRWPRATASALENPKAHARAHARVSPPASCRVVARRREGDCASGQASARAAGRRSTGCGASACEPCHARRATGRARPCRLHPACSRPSPSPPESRPG